MTTTTNPVDAMTQWSSDLGDTMREWWDSSTAAMQPMWDAWTQPWQALAGAGTSSAPHAHTHEHSGHRHAHPHGPGHGHEHGHKHGHESRAGDCGCGCGGNCGGDCGCGADCGCGKGQQGREHAHDHQGRGCCDPCACCIPPADIVVHLRVGERRIVPFELRNERHREREVTPAIGAWTHCDGPAMTVEGVLDTDGAITLAPCERRIVRLLVGVVPTPAQPPAGTATGKQGGDTTAAGKATGTVTVNQPARATDIDACATAYADVRFEGCSRPIRVAVAVSPDACEAYPVTCGCGCCC